MDESYHGYGHVNLYGLDTTPGGSGPLAPPAQWSGDSDAYVALLRVRYQDRGARQHLILAARHRCHPKPNEPRLQVTGPFRASALAVLDALGRNALH